MSLVLFLLFAAMGLALGSFGNVLILRVLSGEGIGGRSHCTECKRTLSALDLIPVLSYIFLRGQCRGCKKIISLQYPLIELGSMALFLLSLFLYPANPPVAFLTGMALCFLLFACVFDVIRQQLPDIFTVIIGVLAFLIVLIHGDFFSSLLGAMIPLVWLGGQWAITRGGSVGTGDIFLGTVLGFWLGLWDAALMMVGSYIIGAIVVLALLALRRIDRTQKRIAFAPFLGIATLLTLLGAGDAYVRMVFGG